MPNEALMELIHQVPALVVLAWVVWKHETSRKSQGQEVNAMTDKFLGVLQQREDTLKHIGEDCHRQARENLDRAIVALDKNTEVIRENTQVLAQVKDRI